MEPSLRKPPSHLMTSWFHWTSCTTEGAEIHLTFTDTYFWFGFAFCAHRSEVSITTTGLKCRIHWHGIMHDTALASRNHFIAKEVKVVDAWPWTYQSYLTQYHLKAAGLIEERAYRRKSWRAILDRVLLMNGSPSSRMQYTRYSNHCDMVCKH